MIAPREAGPTPRAVTLVRALVITTFVTMMFSPPATNLLQGIVFILCIASGEVRARLWAARRQPLVIGALLFLLILLIGAIYSEAGIQAGMVSAWSWRKLLLVPIAAALFVEDRTKVMLLRVMVISCAVVAFASFVTMAVPALLPPSLGDGGRGVLVRNHATQGMIFAMAAFGGASLALFPALGETRARRRLWAFAAVLLAANVIALTSRSGYLVLLTVSAFMGLGWGMNRGLSVAKAAVIAVVATLLLGGLFALSPTTSQRIEQATSEMATYAKNPEYTSMGVRVHFWQNATALIRQRPLLGWGTGAFETAYAREVSGREGLQGLVTGDPHNQYMKIAAEQGLLGLLVFLGFLAMSLRQRPRLAFRILGLGGVAAWGASSLANAHFSTHSEGIFIYLWMGAMLAYDPKVPDAS